MDFFFQIFGYNSGMISMIFIVLALLSNAYFVALHLASPGTFLGTFFSFSSVWFWLSVFFALLFILERRKILKKIFDRIPRKIKTTLVALICFFALVSGFSLFFICTPRKGKADGNEKARYVIVLGGGITKNGELTDSVKNRVQAAAFYLKRNKDALAVVSGGKGRFIPCAEAEVLSPELASFGIDEYRILKEDKAKDTIQNLVFSARLIAEHEKIPLSEVLASPVAICTSDFHLARSERIAKRLGFSDVYGIAAKTPPIFVLNAYCREICSYIKLNLRILLTGKPKKIE